MMPSKEFESAIDITIKSTFITEHIIDGNLQFIFNYTISIVNNSSTSVKLLTRYWLITDADGETTTVEGEGVIGQQPDIAPSNEFTYTSGCILKTPIGYMQGHYQMIDANNNKRLVNIPLFQLAKPNSLH
ncbi:MAG: Co2+/Mg2+ efflux protein ApaG [Colwellia sp.]|nr:Co2+/Mg2+ efflux protein ApaG [Colwellia sp.]